LRAAKDDLARLVTMKQARFRPKAPAKYRKMIDICDFATGSPQLYG